LEIIASDCLNKFFGTKQGGFYSTIDQVALKLGEHVFFEKKGLTGLMQLGNIRIR